MSVELVIRATVHTAEDLVEVIEKWLPIASELDRAKFAGFVTGFEDARRSSARVENETNEENQEVTS